MAIPMAVIAVASSVYSGIQAREKADQQNAYRKQQNEQALKSMQSQYSQLSGAEADARERSIVAGMDNQTEAMRRKSSINLMAAASGTQGLSVDSLLQGVRSEQGRNMNTILNNQEIELQGFRNQAEGIRTQTASRIDNRTIQKPSWGEIGLNAANSGASAYSGAGGSFGGGGNSNPQATMPRSGGWTNSIQTGGV